MKWKIMNFDQNFLRFFDLKKILNNPDYNVSYLNYIEFYWIYDDQTRN